TLGCGDRRARRSAGATRGDGAGGARLCRSSGAELGGCADRGSAAGLAASGGASGGMMEPRRILVLAPHPDDEIVACGIAALRARAAGARVFVLYLTTGVPAPEALWPWQRAGHAARLSRRRTEARLAAALFGMESIGSLDHPSRRLRYHLDAAAAEIGRAIMEHAIEALWVPAF